MAEVFTIAGAHGFGAGTTPCPPGWIQTPNGNCGAPGAPGYRSQVAADLQTALTALGRRAGDVELQKLPIDGVIGPMTVSAVNKAFTTHVGSGQAQAQFRTGKLSLYDVARDAPTFVQLLRAEMVRRGSEVPPTPPPAAGAIPAPPQIDIGPAQIIPVPSEHTGALWVLAAANFVAAGLGAWYLVKKEG
jgi:lysozyme family protein